MWMARKGCIWGWIIGVVALLVIFLITIITIESLLGQRVTLPSYGAHVGLIRVEGVITDSRQFIEDMKTMGRDGGVKAVVLRIDSPGGGVAASQEMYDYIVRFKEKTSLPIVVSMGAVAASGGYYVACPADSIFANPGTITGSIGVVMSFASIEELLAKIGVSVNVVKSGEFKDVGSWSRAMTDEEKALLQTTIDDIHSQFVEAVSDERGIDEASVRAVADGRVFSGRQALALGLVDGLGTLEDAIAAAGRMGGISGKPAVQEPVRLRRLTLRDLLTGTLSRLVDPSARSYGAQYIYEPAK
jgi:protease-4